MNRNRPYDFIKHKPEHSAEADIDALWNDMNKVLDDKMPQQEEKERRVLAWVFRAYLSIILISIGALAVTVYIKYKESKTTSNSEVVTGTSSNTNAVPPTKSTISQSKKTIITTRKTRSIKASEKKTSSVQSQFLNNVAANITSEVNNVPKKVISTNTIDPIHKQSLNKTYCL